MEFWTTTQLAEAAKLDRSHIRYLIRHGKIAAKKTGRDWVVSDEEARRFLAARSATQKITELE